MSMIDTRRRLTKARGRGLTRTRRALWILVVTAALFRADRCRAAETAEWQAERGEIYAMAGVRVEQQVDKLVTEAAVAEELGLKWPLKEPTKTKEEVIAELSASVAERVDETYPESATRSFVLEAEGKYRLHRAGDKVEFVIRGGKGMHTRVRGRLRHVTKRRVHVDDRWIIRSDMEEEDLAKFDPELSAIMKEKHIRVQTLRWLFEREDLQLELEHEQIPQALIEAGYIPKARPVSAQIEVDEAEEAEEQEMPDASIDPEDWVSAIDVFDARYQAAKKRKRRELRPDVEAELFAAHDYVYVAEDDEWVPKAVRRSLTRRLKRLFRKN